MKKLSFGLYRFQTYCIVRIVSKSHKKNIIPIKKVKKGFQVN